jgi:hypothetical protein
LGIELNYKSKPKIVILDGMVRKHEIKPFKSSEVPELRNDRDDALGYSREQFDFEDEKRKPVVKKRFAKKKKLRKPTKRK